MTQGKYTLIHSGAAVAAPTEAFQARHFIDGAWCDSADGATFERHNPATGALVSVAARGGVAETEHAIAAAKKAFEDRRWAGLSGKERAAILNKTADLIAAHKERLALYETLESGKPLSQARAELDGAVDIWRYAAASARRIHGESYNTLGDDMMGLVFKEPVGVVAAITPWNFPFLIVSQKVPFALAAGCSVVLKPSEMTFTTATMLMDLLSEAGVPAGVVNLVQGYGDPVGKTLTDHPDVAMITFTGSTAVGKHIVAASAAGLKKVSLELGGKNPQVVFADGDLDAAADATIFGIFFNAGECCNSSSRVIVHEDVADQFVEKLITLSKKVPFGDPLNETTQVGAMISQDHCAKVHGYVQSALSQGADVVLGGERLEIDGLDGIFYAPTLLRGVTKDMDVAQEEIFGPVLSILTFKTFEEAVDLANASAYGLSSGVWSDDIHTCLAFTRRAEAGTVWVNTWMDGFSELPFGGYKESGLGRELGTHGVEEFLETKTVQMRIGKTRQNWVPNL